MENVLWKMMINNARIYIKTFDPQSGEELEYSIFEICDILSILTGKISEDIMYEIIELNN